MIPHHFAVTLIAQVVLKVDISLRNAACLRREVYGSQHCFWAFVLLLEAHSCIGKSHACAPEMRNAAALDIHRARRR